ncbi:hypothetical protein MNB_SM-4-1336 [hydrothermal vent metagenome]|uniref:Uncharacterized protein n=1 Tax=hydrothermal vent metagenome TaxID=652676 RepID=A0A1W1CKR1_9ZZZZ
MKIKNLYVFILFACSALIAEPPLGLRSGDSVVPHDKAYYKHQLLSNDVEIIYTKDNINFAKKAASKQEQIHKDYEYLFDWKMDETLYVGLISDYNQVANGFSTPLPNNRQINYVGGTQAIDYFAGTSWLETLLYHETAHNYQINVKGSVVSRSLHEVFGNGIVFLPLPIIVPNIVENSFMLEGNAVLNESWHGNGGRLYSGRFKVQTLLQAKDNQLKAKYLYNTKLNFPYREIVYIQGGFYNYYMAKTYGLDKINSYFKYKSEDWWWPFRTNWSMLDAVGKNFETTLKEFESEQKKLAEDVVEAKGKVLAHSQFFSSLGNSEEEIFFITNESGVERPELVVFNKKDKNITKIRDSYKQGKVLKIDGKYYTQASAKTSPIRIHQGLYSNNLFIKEGSESKMVQVYLSDKTPVYFDVASSFDDAKLYIGEKYYESVNSSVIVDKFDNLYYFKQKGKTRTLYKNKTALYSYEGFYGLVSDVDSKGRVYFVANTKLGASVFRYDKNGVKRVSFADNIVEVRLLNDEELFIAAMSAKEYYYLRSKIEDINETPFETKLFFEDEAYYAQTTKESKEEVLDLNDSYYSFLDMHYSGTNMYGILSSNNGLNGSLSINLGDPLSQNTANIFLNRDDSNITIAGLGYTNSQYLLKYQVSLYSVLDKDGRKDVRDSGITARASLPFLEVGYWYGALDISYFQDYETLKREPLSLRININKRERYGVSLYDNNLNSLSLYSVFEREDKIFGGEYLFKHDLISQIYLGCALKYSKTDALTSTNERGVKLSSGSLSQDLDPSTINMPALKNSQYMKSAAYAELNIVKVLNFSAYFFTFPLSLQRESLYAKYRYYDIESFSNKKENSNEVTLGLTLSSVVLNSLPVPISFEYIKSDSDLVKDKDSLRILLGLNF